jgi:DNA-binding transcriptional regulator YiaG
VHGIYEPVSDSTKRGFTMKRVTRVLLEGDASLRGEETDRKRKRNKPAHAEDWFIASTVLGLDDPFHHVKRGLQSFLLQKGAEAASEMGEKEFPQIRHQLVKMERQLARLLGASRKALQSFEQGWRNLPVQTRRRLLFLTALRSSRKHKGGALSDDQAPL